VRKIVIVLLIVGLLVIGLGVGKVAYDRGYRTGYDAGYDAGCDAGYDAGYAAGNNSGYEIGYNLGYDAGYNFGYKVGYDSGYKAGYEEALQRAVPFKNPTYRELMDFLVADETNLNEYCPNRYVCINFAADLNNNAEEAGIRAEYVALTFSSTFCPGGKVWHYINCFQTEKGLIFIEPQLDLEVTVEVGESYWSKIGFTTPEDYDDTIIDIIIIW